MERRRKSLGRGSWSARRATDRAVCKSGCGRTLPVAQTGNQRRVEARIQEMADSASRKLGIDRRRFLAGTGGMAASLLAMNEGFGRFFDVDPIEMRSEEHTS